MLNYLEICDKSPQKVTNPCLKSQSEEFLTFQSLHAGFHSLFVLDISVWCLFCLPFVPLLFPLHYNIDSTGYT